MAEDYTPTTEQVRFAFIDREDFEAQVGGFERPTDEESGAAFDRWLAGERARVLREAADALERATCEVKRTCHEADAITLRMRADWIERGEGL